ncbi:hypothetical protein DFH08DRAFT_799107 [Mycena albidolilacea]|uniref:Uncharacterized protein n=1 Tax=Mycena albidolilacea TaxID=1033008 RepID=A0AAD7F2L5_9AGAR|nr:hypothetical protein DFH08DRAFT_799107 [Mycena albidolilacea]
MVWSSLFFLLGDLSALSTLLPEGTMDPDPASDPESDDDSDSEPFLTSPDSLHDSNQRPAIPTHKSFLTPLGPHDNFEHTPTIPPCMSTIPPPLFHTTPSNHMARDHENIVLEKEAEKKRRDDERLAKETEEQRLHKVQACPSFKVQYQAGTKLSSRTSPTRSAFLWTVLQKTLSHKSPNTSTRMKLCANTRTFLEYLIAPILDHQPPPMPKNVTNLQGNVITGPSNAVADCMDGYFNVHTLSHTQPAYF